MHLFITLAFISIVLALPLPIEPAPSCPEKHAINVLEYDETSQHLRFSYPCNDCLIAEASADESLVFDLLPAHCQDITSEDCLDLAVNGQNIHFTPDSDTTSVVTASTTISTTTSTTASTTASLIAADSQGNPHEISLRISISAGTEVREYRRGHAWSQQVQFHIQSIDNKPVESKFFNAHWLRSASGQAELAYLDIVDTDTMSDIIDFRCYRQRDEETRPLLYDELVDEEEQVVKEIEALRVLEQEVLNLQNEIATRRQAVLTRVAGYRSRRPLKELIEQCDGLVCAANQIATRLYDSINLATSDQQMLYQSTTISKAETTHQNQTNFHTYVQDSGSSNGYMLKALMYIASILGLSAILNFIRRKCTSMRTRVERAADLEERRNARAYRKAARRAEMRLWWSNIVKAVNCLKIVKQQPPPRLTDYDEKRALILQDALLEQDFSQFEKGDIMEAEIRELRNAHDIVSGILHLRRDRDAANAPVKDPPPPLVPLPSSPCRSRASTSTLPSYNSEDPPDYSSIPEPTHENTTTDGFAYYRPTSFEDDADHAPRVAISTVTRSTPTSSVVAISRRASAETLHTRASRVGSRCSRH